MGKWEKKNSAPQKKKCLMTKKFLFNQNNNIRAGILLSDDQARNLFFCTISFVSRPGHKNPQERLKLFLWTRDTMGLTCVVVFAGTKNKKYRNWMVALKTKKYKARSQQ